MTQQTWHDSLESELKKQRLPKKYVRRYLAELSAHAEDLRNGRELEEGAFVARIGEPAKLAQQAGESYRASCFARKHPVWTYVIAPLPLAVLVFYDVILVLMALGEMVDLFWTTPAEPITTQTAASLIFELLFAIAVSCILPYVLAAGICVSSSHKYGVRSWWPVASAVLLGSASACTQFTLSTTQYGPGWIAIGLVLPPWVVQHPFHQQPNFQLTQPWLQFITPVLTCIACQVWFAHYNRKRSSLAVEMPGTSADAA